ncbi:hypothetical protein BC939DRAFT_473008 [Gamsiella multidivaricata]|uniref:uncharacterized protein n=1 Tax=Gamsiella multidivaricata TaxID=101098 RepID=UPI00221F0812|nr:uncharacterized protein BC939DRAFT_473008 [Gamsiella multidivaricata]KAG0365924.1 hypothetical protein BGZ54_006052 [Gamsiella multidivaricata]KAI7831439.1 hypothetical protein BC939DRAFT_473008 [Gamsiella multidivaricata]
MSDIAKTTLLHQISTLEKERKVLRDTFGLLDPDGGVEAAVVKIDRSGFPLIMDLWKQAGKSERKYPKMLLAEDQVREDQIKALKEALQILNPTTDQQIHLSRIAKDEKVELAKIAKDERLLLTELAKWEKVRLIEIARDREIRLAEFTKQEKVRFEELRVREVELKEDTKKEVMMNGAELKFAAKKVEASMRREAQMVNATERRAMAVLNHVQQMVAETATAARTREGATVVEKQAYTLASMPLDKRIQGDIDNTVALVEHMMTALDSESSSPGNGLPEDAPEQDDEPEGSEARKLRFGNLLEAAKQFKGVEDPAFQEWVKQQDLDPDTF